MREELWHALVEAFAEAEMNAAGPGTSAVLRHISSWLQLTTGGTLTDEAWLPQGEVLQEDLLRGL
jgi:hypothetical protein